eukprot:2216757-Rhodomonas_salina.1
MYCVVLRLVGKKTITDKNIESALKDVRTPSPSFLRPSFALPHLTWRPTSTWQVRRSLLEADVNLDVATKLIDEIKQRSVGIEVIEGVDPAQQFIKIMQVWCRALSLSRQMQTSRCTGKVWRDAMVQRIGSRKEADGAMRMVQEELTSILGGSIAPLARKETGITTILMTGLQ